MNISGSFYPYPVLTRTNELDYMAFSHGAFKDTGWNYGANGNLIKASEQTYPAPYRSEILFDASKTWTGE